MITAQEAYKNYVAHKNMSQIERFVNSVLQEVITEEHIATKSVNEKRTNFTLSTIFSKIFLTNEINGRTVYTGWKLYFEDLPSDVYGKYNHEIVADLQHLFAREGEDIYICKAFKALVHELSIVRKFNVALDLRKEILTVSWDLSSKECK